MATPEALRERTKDQVRFAEQTIWNCFLERHVALYGAIPERTPEDAATLREIRIRARRSVGKACRRIERAFADPARVKRGISLESILGDWRELAA